MPRLTQAVPKYRKHRASGQAVVTINGADHYLGPHGTKASKLEYDRLITEWLASGRSTSWGVSESDLTVAELLAAFRRWAKSYYRGKGTGSYERLKRVMTPLKELYGRTAAAEFGPAGFKAVRQKFIDKGHCRSYINEQMRRITQIFRWGAGEGLIPPTVPQTLALIPGLRKGRCDCPEAKPILPVDEAVVDATIEKLPEVVADMVRLQRYTGMRPAEVCLLRPCDVNCSGDVWSYMPKSHKTEHHGRKRTIFIGPKGQAILLRYLARDPKARCFRPVDSEAKRRAERHAKRNTPLSCGNKPGSVRTLRPKRTAGEEYTVASYRRAIHRAAAKAKVEKWSPNRLRHAAATEIRSKFGLEAAQVALGHAAANVTQIYAERDAEKARDVARKIG